MDDVYIIEGAGHTLTYRGIFIWKNLLDLFIYQDIVEQVRPTLVIETGTHKGGSALFWADMLSRHGRGRVVTVDKEDYGVADDKRITRLIGSSIDDEIVAQVRACVRPRDRVLVNLDSLHSYEHVSRELELYAPLVSEGSYLICEDGIDEVLLGGHFLILTATRDFVAAHPEFEVDSECERYLLTNCPEGFLRRVA